MSTKWELIVQDIREAQTIEDLLGGLKGNEELVYGNTVEEARQKLLEYVPKPTPPNDFLEPQVVVNAYGQDLYGAHWGLKVQRSEDQL